MDDVHGCMDQYLWALHARTQKGEGSGREPGQPATTNNGKTSGKSKGRQQAEEAHNKHAEQMKRRRGKVGKGSTREPNPGT